MMVDYLQDQSQTIARRCDVSSGDLVLEFGCNDGCLLRFFKELGAEVLGVDPAINIVRDVDPSLPIIPEYFSSHLARRILKEYRRPKVICAYNVFAHIADMQDIFEAVSILLDETNTFVFEVGYFVDVFKNGYFDTIYHEHLDYHRVEPLWHAFRKHGLTLVHAERSSIQGGALVGYVRRGIHAMSSSVSSLIAEERSLNLSSLTTFQAWSNTILSNRDQLMKLLNQLHDSGKTIAGYGAPAKATTLMYHYSLDSSIIDFIAEDNPLKQGLFTPGLHIPVTHPSKLLHEMPDYTLILAWNFADSIINNNIDYLQRGGRFIVPLPDVRIVSTNQYD